MTAGSGQPSWRIEISSAGLRGLNRLPARVSTAIVEFMTGPLAENPFRVSKALSGEPADYRSARRGDYRVIVKILEQERVVLVDRVAHRAHVYRGR